MRAKRWQLRKCGFASIWAIFGPLYHAFQACSLAGSLKLHRTT
jgi:hypothetical protein